MTVPPYLGSDLCDSPVDSVFKGCGRLVMVDDRIAHLVQSMNEQIHERTFVVDVARVLRYSVFSLALKSSDIAGWMNFHALNTSCVVLRCLVWSRHILSCLD